MKKGTAFQKYTGIRNAMAAISGVNLDELVGSDGENYKVAKTIYNDKGKAISKEAEEDKDNYHVRKLGKLIFGVNGDSDDEKTKIVDAIIKDKQTVISGAFAKAKAFATKNDKNLPNDETIKKAVNSYLANYINEAYIKVFANKYKKILKVTNYGGGTHTFSEIGDIIGQLNKNRIYDSIFNVVTSKTEYNSENPKALGIMKYQNKRLDHYNPQFGAV
jgi:hypothetical protein